MNKQRLLEVADAIEAGKIRGEPVGFNMGTSVSEFDPQDPDSEDWFIDVLDRPCEISGCIAGYAVLLFDGRAGTRRYDIVDRAAELLGLQRHERDELFETWTEETCLPVHAVAVLRHAAEHGAIDWDVANPELVAA